MNATKTIEKADLEAAYTGSFYTIAGAGGDLQEWVAGYEKELEAQGIGTPTQWFVTSGAEVNLYAIRKLGGLTKDDDQFPDDLVILLFPLDGLNVGKLAMFKLNWEDRWFDDVIGNVRRA